MIKITITKESQETLQKFYNSLGKDLKDKELAGIKIEDMQVPNYKSKGMEVINSEEGNTIILKNNLLEKVLDLYGEYIPQIFTAVMNIDMMFKKMVKRYDSIMEEYLMPEEEKKEEAYLASSKKRILNWILFFFV